MAVYDFPVKWLNLIRSQRVHSCHAGDFLTHSWVPFTVFDFSTANQLLKQTRFLVSLIHSNTRIAKQNHKSLKPDAVHHLVDDLSVRWRVQSRFVLGVRAPQEGGVVVKQAYCEIRVAFSFALERVVGGD